MALCKWMNGWSLDDLYRAGSIYAKQIGEMMIEEHDRMKHPEDYENEDD